MFLFCVLTLKLLLGLCKVDDRCKELMKNGVTEKDITRSIIEDVDTYSLGSSRSVYKCALQFHHRMRMARLLLGSETAADNETLSQVLQYHGCA